MAQPFSHLMLATEHSEYDVGAEALAFELARRCALPLAAVLPILSNPEYEAMAPELAERADAQAAARIRSLAQAAQREGVEIHIEARHGSELAQEIVDEAVERGADLLVIRRRGRRGLFRRLLIGEMVRSVVERAPCSVLVAPRAARMWSAGVLVASDPDATDMTPVSTAAAIAAECALPLAIVAVCDATPPAIQRAEAALARAAAAARAFAVEPVMLLRHGRAHEQIIDAARERGADLIVVGRRGDESLAHAWLGGTAQKTVGLAAHAVLVAINPSAQHSPHP